MKSLISLVMAAFVLGFIFSAELIAEHRDYYDKGVTGKDALLHKWEKKLMNEGWVKQKGVFWAFADTTWYGRNSKYSDREKKIFYIVPSGKNIFFQFNKGGTIHLGIREKYGAESFCTRFEFEAGGRKRCNKTVWKKGNVYLIASFNGYMMGVYSVKKGNLENFR